MGTSLVSVFTACTVTFCTAVSPGNKGRATSLGYSQVEQPSVVLYTQTIHGVRGLTQETLNPLVQVKFSRSLNGSGYQIY